MTEIGHNGGPVLDPLAALAIEAGDLVDEADGLTDIVNQAQADAVQKLIDDAKDSGKAIDAAKAVEKRPHLDANIAIEERYKPVKAMADKAKDTAQRKLTPWLLKLDADRREVEKLAREKADALAAEALTKHQSDDLHDQLEAEADIAAAAKLTASANKIAKQATGLRTVWDMELTDPVAFGKWAWGHRNAQYKSALYELARNEQNGFEMPGITWTARKVAK
jgi:regulator of extracellular matrix RemA (YlzA/DUF370 family)